MIGKALLLLLLQRYAELSWAYEECDYGGYCYDTDYKIGYCCGVVDFIPFCCYYTDPDYIPWYSLWYVWFSIAVGILIVVTIVVICCTKYRSSRRAAGTSRSVTVATVTNTTATIPDNTNIGFRMDDDPPSYETIQQHQQWMSQHSSEKYPPYPAPELPLYSETSFQNQPADFYNAPTCNSLPANNQDHNSSCA